MTCRILLALTLLPVLLGGGCSPPPSEAPEVPASPPSPSPPRPFDAPAGAVSNLHDRLLLVWQADGKLHLLEEALPEDLWDAVPGKDGTPAPSPKALSLARGAASEARRLLRPRELGPAIVPGMPEVAGGLDQAALYLMEAVKEYETALAGLSARSVSLAERSLQRAREQRVLGMDALRLAAKGAIGRGEALEYRMEEDGSLLRCEKGRWLRSTGQEIGSSCSPPPIDSSK